jgi:hypothetical protein
MLGSEAWAQGLRHRAGAGRARASGSGFRAVERGARFPQIHYPSTRQKWVLVLPHALAGLPDSP